MATEFKVRRGTTAEHAAFTGAEGEITLDTTKDTLVVHDAYTAGGYPMLREDLNNLADGSVNRSKIQSGTQGDILYYNASGDLAVLGAGTAGQLLQTNGAGANPSWSTLASAYLNTSATSTGTNTDWVARWGLAVQSENMSLVSNTWMEIQIPGVYYFEYAGISENNSATYEMIIRKTTESPNSYFGRSYSNISGHSWLHTTRVIRCAAGDRVGVSSHNAGGTTYVYADGHGFWRGVKVGE